ncbi:isochorismatase family cysteine hydrolase [Paenibacillus sp. JX-17]|uniref:Isochorismatase family cysteine hydrolase n=1 Tax=Paenibacillus lacisoli TaxID=3064525 RepID=A0ABT9CEG9_9BACL|nr:isochorismatase family cysteine hydrolase [Paenibacillus sp. JX-17]MDO7907669.1 isochorismatase family cysteine hydrolase [Paenibacillus sp. JX-17]
MKIAYLIIDMQSVYLQEDPLEQKVINRACMYINYVADLMRSKGQLVVHIQDIEGRDESNHALYEVVPEIDVRETDLKLTKENSNAFWQTDLEQILRDHGVELVVIAGFAAEHCVLFTYNGANERGFKPVLLQNGILSTHSDIITSTYRDRNLISHPVIQFMLNQ